MEKKDMQKQKDDIRFETAMKWWEEMNETGDLGHVYGKIEETIDRKDRKRRRRFFLRGTAAAAVLLAVVGTWLAIDNTRIGKIPTIGKISDNAVLIMSDGSQVVLDRTTENSRVAFSDNINVIHKQGGLVYEAQENTAVSETTLYSTLNIPKGMIFDVVLEDGTHIWLNADSKLHFPATFDDDERRVRLEGEGYFDVAHDAGRPFVVETPGQAVTVLGTQFNVSAYPDEQKEFTTLVEGSVSLSLPGGGSETMLRAGQQAVLSSASGKFLVNEVDTGDISIWRAGMFSFDGHTLSEVFVMLSRWYDFDYSLDSALDDIVFKGNLRVTEDVNSIFRIIERSGQVEIAARGKTIEIKMTK